MVLADTSVLIAYLSGVADESTEKLQYVLDGGLPFGINSVIYQEVLQGVKTEKEFSTVKKYLDTLKLYGWRDERESYASAAKIYFDCRKRGMTVGTIDCLIAQTAIENGLFLLHGDSDFDRMSRVSGLKIFRI